MLTQTRRHSYLVSLLGIRHVVLAVNKMDLVGWSKETYDSIVADYVAFAREIGLPNIVPIPISGLKGDNITSRSANAPWHEGPVLIDHLETVEIDVSARIAKPFRMPVQWVNRPNLDFRGFAGTIASGTIAAGARVRVLPSGRETKITRIVTKDGDLARAIAGQSVTLTFADEVDCSRGDVIAAAGAPAEVADQFETMIVWMAEEELLPGRPYWLKIGTKTVAAQVTEIKHKVNVNTLEHLAAKTLALNEIALCNISVDQSVAFEAYTDNRDLGGFILIDRMTNGTVGAGMIRFALRRAQNIHWQALSVDRLARASLKHQKPAVLWFTGLSGAGKSTIADLVEKRLLSMGPPRRRQHPPRAQPRSRFHRCRPRREHPPRRRSREADGGCGAHRARLLLSRRSAPSATWRGR